MSTPYNFAAKLHVSSKANPLKLRLSVYGPPGAGKTVTMLKTAFGLLADKPNPRVLVADTENRSAVKHAGQFPPFDVVDLSDDQGPQCMKALIEYAEAEKYDVLIIDSLSHEWSGRNGVLEQVDLMTAKTGKPTEAWRYVTEFHDDLFRSIVNSNIHVLCTFRCKQQVAIEKDSRGKTIVRRLPMQPIAREGSDYEFDITSRMEVEGNVLFIEKSRCPELNGKVFRTPNTELADILIPWLNGGERLPVSARTVISEGSQPATVADKAPDKVADSPSVDKSSEKPANKKTEAKAEKTVEKKSDKSAPTDDERASYISAFADIAKGNDAIVNSILMNAEIPFLSIGQTWKDLSLDSLKTLRLHEAELKVRIAAERKKTERSAASA